MAIMEDSILWIASAYDTVAQGEDLPVGGGLSYTKDSGETWAHISQPIDSVDEQDYAPTTTTIQNLTYDIAFVDGTVWIASFGGGLRKSDDMGETWQVKTTDGLFFSSGVHLNHRVFSLLTIEDTLWVGSAEGISKTTDNGETWERFTAVASEDTTISGNFIVALAYQEETKTIWAATMPAENSGEIRAVCKSTDWGKNWQRLLVDEQFFAHNFAFADERVYVTSDMGLYYSNNEGQDWEVPLTNLQDAESGEEIFQEEYYSAAVQELNGQETLWLGNSDGLAKTRVQDDLTVADWDIVRSYVSTTVRTKPKVYAYPSPFSPSRHNYARFEFDSDEVLNSPIKIYDFAMDHVATVPMDDFKPKWDGTNVSGDNVASGVYFFRAKVGGKVTWGKIVVIN